MKYHRTDYGNRTIWTIVRSDGLIRQITKNKKNGITEVWIMDKDALDGVKILEYRKCNRLVVWNYPLDLPF